MRMIQMLNDARDGYFHEFVHQDGETYGIIEFLDGTISVINIIEFKFKETPYPKIPPIPQYQSTLQSMPDWPTYPAVSKS